MTACAQDELYSFVTVADVPNGVFHGLGTKVSFLNFRSPCVQPKRAYAFLLNVSQLVLTSFSSDDHDIFKTIYELTIVR
jgi:hypothetical protein